MIPYQINAHYQELELIDQHVSVIFKSKLLGLVLNLEIFVMLVHECTGVSWNVSFMN